jgi:hypothetical protein
VKRLLYIGLGVVTFSSCGPVDYLHTVTLKATRSLAEARAAEAEKLSPYEYWSAVEYLQMAKEKAAYAEYEIAISYGDKAESMANDAKRLASERVLEGPRRINPGSKPSGEDEIPADLKKKSSSTKGNAP